MAEANGSPAVIEPGQREVIEAGRYKLSNGTDGWTLGRATDLCDRCASCGCGTQQPTVPLPDPNKGQRGLMQWMVTRAPEVRAALAGLMQDGEPVD